MTKHHLIPADSEEVIYNDIQNTFLVSSQEAIRDRKLETVTSYYTLTFFKMQTRKIVYQVRHIINWKTVEGQMVSKNGYKNKS